MFSKLQSALDSATKKTCRSVVSKYSAEGIYSFALYTSGEYSYVLDSFSTVKGLETVASKYLQKETYIKKWGTVEVAMRELKWSPCDSPYHCQFESNFEKANAILEELWHKVEEDSEEAYLETCHQIYELFHQAMLNVRNSGVFDDAVVLNVLMGDQSNEERFLNAEPLNAKSSLTKFRKELEVDTAELSRLRKSRWKA